MKRIFKKENLLSILVVLTLMIFVYSVLKTAFVPKPVVGDNISISKNRVPIELGIVNVDEKQNNIYLFDSIRNNLYVYDSNGKSVINIENIPGGLAYVQTVNEVDGYITFEYVREDLFVTVDYLGNVIETKELEQYNSSALEVSSSFENYKLKNWLFFYTLYDGEERIMIKPSLLPVIITGIVVFFGGLFVSQKQLQKRVNNGEEIKVYGIKIFNRKK